MSRLQTSFRLAVIGAALFCASPYLTARAAPAQAAPSQAAPSAAETARATPSGMPVPRFVSLKSARTFCRAGPSFDHPIAITFMRADLPVRVVAETRDNWRKVVDRDGDACWIHRSKLSGRRTAVVIDDGVALRVRPNFESPSRAALGRGLVARVEKTEGAWLRVTAGGVRGWAPRSAFWGAS